MARGSTSLGTSMGPIAPWAGPRKAREAPNTAAMEKIGKRLTAGCSARPARPSTATSSAARQIRMMLRRSWRSATAPATKVRANSGRNWTSPTMPTRKALCSTPLARRARV